MDTNFLRTTLAECLRCARFAVPQTHQEAGDTVSSAALPAGGYGSRTPSLPVRKVPKKCPGILHTDVIGTTNPTPAPLAEPLEEPLHLYRPSARVGEQAIRNRLAQAERLIRQEHTAQALRLLHAPGAPPSDWPVRWHPCWYLLVGWALIRTNHPHHARSILVQGLETLKPPVRRPRAARLLFLREAGAWLRYFLGVSFDQSAQPGQALCCYQQALSATTDGAIHDPELQMLIFQGLGNTFLALGASEKAVAYFALAQQHGLDVCDPRAQGLTEWGLGLACSEQGDLPQAK